MRVCFDLNVVIDALTVRGAFFESAANLWSEISSRGSRPFISAHAVTTFWYIVSNERSKEIADESTQTLLNICEIIPIDTNVLQHAWTLGFKDYEDAVTVQAALSAQCTLIASRDISDFAKSPIAAMLPQDCTRILRNE